jgi:exodeoxyribonuclease-3
MKIVTWNVNSLKVRLPHVLDWLAAHKPDALCLQELKLEDKAFPLAEIEAAGYHAVYIGQKTYNGVAIISPRPIDEASVVRNIPGFEDEQKRLIAATIDGVRVVCGYFPNGQAVGSDKFEYKLKWLTALTDWLREELKTHERLVLAGDFNIAPEDRDAHPDWKDEIHVSEPERAAFCALQDLGLIDSFRLFEQPERAFSWWDYRMLAFRRNFGLRIDHLLVSPALREACRSCAVDKEPRRLERPSDHAPVVLELDVGA